LFSGGGLSQGSFRISRGANGRSLTTRARTATPQGSGPLVHPRGARSAAAAAQRRSQLSAQTVGRRDHLARPRPSRSAEAHNDWFRGAATSRHCPEVQASRLRPSALTAPSQAWSHREGVGFPRPVVALTRSFSPAGTQKPLGASEAWRCRGCGPQSPARALAFAVASRSTKPAPFPALGDALAANTHAAQQGTAAGERRLGPSGARRLCGLRQPVGFGLLAAVASVLRCHSAALAAERPNRWAA
jgi:hypothetical protein